MSLSSIPSSLRVAVRARDNGCCAYCQLRQAGQAAAFHIDHLIPRSKRGSTTLENLVLQCPHCGLRKSDKMEAIDPDTGTKHQLFHPLAQAWIEHFGHLRDGTCVGKSGLGRATVAALRMNDPMPRTARAIQMMLGIL